MYTYGHGWGEGTAGQCVFMTGMSGPEGCDVRLWGEWTTRLYTYGHGRGEGTTDQSVFMAGMSGPKGCDVHWWVEWTKRLCVVIGRVSGLQVGVSLWPG